MTGLGGAFAKYSAQTLYMVAGSKAVEDKERGYQHPMDFRNKVSRIPDSVVDVLHKAVTTLGGELTRRYYRLKAKHLGVALLRWSDRNAPMPFADTTFVPFEEASGYRYGGLRRLQPYAGENRPGVFCGAAD